MIRIFIVADSNDRAETMAVLLEEDHRFELRDIHLADVILCLGVSLGRLPRRGKPVVAVSALADGDAPFDETLKAWLPASSSLDDIVAGLVAAAAGMTVLTGSQAKRVFKRGPNNEEREPEALTAREQEVLQMMGAGLANKEIAARLGITLNTAKFHVTQILAKLNAGSRTEAASIAIRRGLLPL